MAIDLTDIGKIGIQTSTPAQILDINGLPSPGAAKAVVFRNSESGAGEYGITHFAYDGNNGETRKDFVLTTGYNAGGPEFVSGEPELTQSFESRFKTNSGTTQSEYYITAAANGHSSRPIAIDLYHATGDTQVTLNTPSLFISNPAQTNLWFRAQTSDTEGDLILQGSSGINYSGTREWIISRYGLGILGSTSNTAWELCRGGLNGETLTIFKQSDMSQPLTLKLGSSGSGFRIDSSHRMQVSGDGVNYSNITTDAEVSVGQDPDTIVRRGASGEVTVGSIWVRGKRVVGTQQNSIDDAIVGDETDNSRAINQLLGALRAHGFIAGT